MNRRGQTLVMFVMLLPVILFLFAYVVDMGKVYYEQNRLKNLVLSMDGISKEKMEEALSKNDEKIQLKSYEERGDQIKIEVGTSVESLFGNLIGIKTYKVQAEIQMKKEK